jgi:hypothetical protein
MAPKSYAQKPTHTKLDGVFATEVLQVPDLHINILSFDARGPPVSARSISDDELRIAPSKHACALFFCGAGLDPVRPISLCSYIQNEDTHVMHTSPVEISTGPTCQIPNADEPAAIFCANLAFSMSRILREFVKQRFAPVYRELVILKLRFPSFFSIIYFSWYTPSGHQKYLLKFQIDERDMAFYGEYYEASPTEDSLKRQQMEYGVPDSYPQSLKQKELVDSFYVRSLGHFPIQLRFRPCAGDH